MTVRLGADASRLNSGLRGARTQMSTFQKQVKSLKSTMLTMFGIGAGISVMVGAARTVKDFDQATADLAAITGKSRDEIKSLTDQSLRLGATTRFTAVAISGLQKELAKLGFTAPEIIQSTKAVQNFAAATGADLSAAAKVAGVAVRAFGLSTYETEDAVATMAVATTKSAIAFDDFETILSTVGPVAKAFNFSLEDTIALASKLRDAGFDASKAGTAMRNIFLNLANTNGKLAKALGRPVKTFPELIQGLKDLKERGVSLNETLQLTDKRSVAAFNQFLNTADAALKLRDGITGVNDELQVMVDKQLNTLAGQIDLLKSAWQGFVLSIEKGDGVIGGLVSGSLKVFTDALTELSNLDLIFTRSKKLSDEQVSRTYDVLAAMSRAKEGLKFQNVVKEFDKVNYVILKFKENQKEAFMDALHNAGFSSVEQIKLWDEYLRRRQEQFETENAKTEAYQKRLTESASDNTKERIKLSQEEALKIIKEQERINNIFKSSIALAKSSALQQITNVKGKETPVNKDYFGSFDMPSEEPIDKFYDKIKTAATELRVMWKEMDMGKKVADALANSVGDLGDAFSNMIQGQVGAFKDFISSLLEGFRQIINALLAEAIAGMIANGASKGLPGLIAASIGVAAIEGLWKAKVPEFASGGLVYGDTMARVGEYPGASSNPEVIAPLSKLEGLMGGRVVFEIKQDRLVGILQKANVKNGLY